MPSPDNFTTLYAVELYCNSCVDSVTKALHDVKGVDTVDCDIKNQVVSVRGHVAPSLIVKAIQGTGRDAIIRGTGAPNSAAVCILENFADLTAKSQVQGLVRLVSVAPERTLFDITLDGLEKGTYYLSIRSGGDLSGGATSTGRELLALGPVEVDNADESQQNSGSGQTFVSKNISINSIIGRSIAVSKFQDRVQAHSLVGIIARSAGVWENLKSVCSCSGKTVWQERQEALNRGVK